MPVTRTFRRNSGGALRLMRAISWSTGLAAQGLLTTVSTEGNIWCVGKIRRGNYVFLTYKGDHTPRHVHVYRDRRLVLKWDLENGVAMLGRPTRRILELIRELQGEGQL